MHCNVLLFPCEQSIAFAGSFVQVAVGRLVLTGSNHYYKVMNKDIMLIGVNNKRGRLLDIKMTTEIFYQVLLMLR